MLQYHVSLPCPATEAAATLGAYLRARHSVVEAPDSVTVIGHTPLLFFSLDRRLYSAGNRTGLNPLALIGTVRGHALPADAGSTLEVSISSFRIYLFPVLWAFVAIVAASEHAPFGAWLFLSGILAAYSALVGWLTVRGLRSDFLTYSRTRL